MNKYKIGSLLINSLMDKQIFILGYADMRTDKFSKYITMSMNFNENNTRIMYHRDLVYWGWIDETTIL